jgi:hypothetical protein
VLVVKSTTYGTVHEAGCWHIGAPTEPRVSVGRKNVCGAMGEVKEWAMTRGIETDCCRSCLG